MSNPEPQNQAPQAPQPQQWQPGYPTTVYAVVAPQPKGLSVTSMVLGLVSIVFGFTFFLPIVSLVLGILGIRREPAGRGMAIAGVIISSLILAFWVVLVGILIVISLIGAAALGSVSTIEP